MSASHISTQQWQSFEGRMRQRRLERCLLRAEAALEAGEEAAARDAIDEAKQLDHRAPDLDSIRVAITQRQAAARAAAAAEMAAIADASQRQQRQRTRRAVAAAGLGLALFGGSAAVIYRATGEPRVGMLRDAQRPLATAPSTVQRVPAAAPSPAPPAVSVSQSALQVPTVARQPVTGESGEVPTQSSGPAANQPVTRSAAPPLPVAVPQSDAVPAARNTIVEEAPAVSRTETPQVTATPLASAPGDVASVPPPPAPPPSEERPRAVPPLASAAPLSAPAAAGATTPAPAPVPDEAARVRSVLAQYEAAYSTLNADAAQAIWPAVDGRLLSRAFQNLESQRISLGQCALAIDGGTARADCDGSATWTPKVGGGSRTESRHWKFELQNTGGSWQIVTAAARNP